MKTLQKEGKNQLKEKRDKEIKEFKQALQYIQKGDIGSLRQLRNLKNVVNLRAENSWTLIHYAVFMKQEDITEYLLKLGADVNVKNDSGYTPLMYSAQSGDEIILGMLIEHGALLDDVDSEGRTALHYAIENGSTTLLNFILAYGANPNVFDKKYFTPLHYAVQKKQYKLTEILLNKGADVNSMFPIKREHGAILVWSPLHIAVQTHSIHMVELLLSYKANVNIYNRQNVTPLHFAAQYDYPDITSLLIENGAKLNHKDQDGDTPLCLAIRLNYDRNVELLVNRKNASMFNNEFMAPLHIAAQSENLFAAQKLLEYGASVHVVDSEGNTPLHWAVKSNSESVTRLLLDYGSDPMKRNGPKENGSSPFVIAKGECSHIIKEFLEKQIQDNGTLHVTPKTPRSSKQAGSKNQNDESQMLKPPMSICLTNRNGEKPRKSNMAYQNHQQFARTSQSFAHKTKASKSRPLMDSPNSAGVTGGSYRRFSPRYQPKQSPQSKTPMKDELEKNSPTSLFMLEKQIDAAIYETRKMMADQFAHVGELIEEIRKDFA